MNHQKVAYPHRGLPLAPLLDPQKPRPVVSRQPCGTLGLFPIALCVEREGGSLRTQGRKWERDPGSGPCSDPKGLCDQVPPWLDSHEAVLMAQGREGTVQPAHAGDRK